MSTTSASGHAAVPSGAAGGGRVADVDRRFYAFAVDRTIAWSLDAVVAVVVARSLLAHDHPLAGALLIVATVLVVGLAFAVLQGTTGTTPGKALAGLRLVDTATELPVGVSRAVLRTLVLGLAALPFGFGLAALAWTAVADRSRLRRGWHDHLVSSVVLDVRRPVVAEVEDEDARRVVNLTAMRLAPSRPTPGPAEAATVPGRSSSRPRHMAPRPEEPAGPRRPSAWAVAFDSGQRVVVDTLLLVGRSPEPGPGELGARLVALPSADLSVSKTHVQLVVAADGALVVTDRGSTNGSTLVRRGVPRDLTPGRPATLLEGDTVLLGDRTMRVEPPQRARSQGDQSADPA